MDKNSLYNSYDYDTLTPGSKLKIDHTVYLDKIDLSDLISLPLAKVLSMREKNAKTEQAAYEKVRAATREWEAVAAQTQKYDKAIEYLKMPETAHTSNKWVADRYDTKEMSNKVYKMTYRVYEYKSYRDNATIRWDLNWSIYTNSPNKNSNKKIAGQDKNFTSKEAMEKYLQGRIKAYSHLFTEISPPIPDEHKSPFVVNGHLLPGYTSASEVKKDIEVKPSVRSELKSLAEKNKAAPSKKSPAPKRTEQEI